MTVIIFMVTHIPRVCLLEHSEDYNQGYDAAPKAFNILESINTLWCFAHGESQSFNKRGLPHSFLFIYLRC